MRQILLTAMHSGAGKTVVTCTLLTALKNRGMDVHAFKCGPDYIDPMFHKEVLGVPSRNLDLFLQGESGVQSTLSRNGGDFAVMEGTMGYYDGLNATDEASTWAVAHTLHCPSILILKPQGSALTTAAQVKGLLQFREESYLSAILLDGCKASVAERLSQMLERETGLPVLGFLPPMKEAELPSRHLGLFTAGEITDLRSRFDTLARQMEQSVDMDALIQLSSETALSKPVDKTQKKHCAIAVSRDEAFCFLYEDNLDALQRSGAELLFFSPLRDGALPSTADGVYLCGGYPELFAKQLAANTGMRQSIRSAVTCGMPTVAECGGFLYLQQCLEGNDGDSSPMCGVFSGTGVKTGTLQRFGYLVLSGESDSLLFRKGEAVPAHEFHYWDCTENGTDLLAQKADGRSWRCGFTGETLYAAFPHIHFGGELPLAERFAEACIRYADIR